MTKIGGIASSVLHLCNNRRHLLFALSDIQCCECDATILFLEDDLQLDQMTKDRIAELLPSVKLLTSTDQKEVEQFAQLPRAFPDLLRRNIQPFGKRSTDWILPILAGQEFEIGYVYHPGFFASKAMAASCKTVVMREAGLNNYVSHPVRGVKRFVRLLMGLPSSSQTWGEESWIDQIEVAHPSRLPARVQHKAAQLSFSQILQGLRDDHVEKLRNIFVQTPLPVLPHDARSALLLTQPIDKIGFCTRRQKKEIFSSLADQLKQLGYEVYVKHHPTDEPFNIGALHELSKDFPIELWLALTQSKFTLAVSICSASLVEGQELFAERAVQLVVPEHFGKSAIAGILEEPAEVFDKLRI